MLLTANNIRYKTPYPRKDGRTVTEFKANLIVNFRPKYMKKNILTSDTTCQKEPLSMRYVGEIKHKFDSGGY